MHMDDWLPAYDFSSVHAITILEVQEVAYAALLRADLARPLLVRSLMWLRSLPAWNAGRPGPTPPPDYPVRALAGLEFTVLADAPPNELLLGLEGRFWEPSGGLRKSAPDDFMKPIPPGYARALWNFTLAPQALGTRLRTETRVACGDPESRRRFARYWRVVAPFSGLLRRAMLAEVAREAAP